MYIQAKDGTGSACRCTGCWMTCDGRLAQRLSPRRKNSHWTKLNMDRCMDLEDRGLMTPAGRRAFEIMWKAHDGQQPDEE